MIQKKVLSNFISKYHLNGLIERVQWDSNNGIKMGFVNESKTLLGYITIKDINFPKGKIGIFDTGKLNKMLNILDGELLVDIQKNKLFLEDTNYSISCNLADPSIIPQLPSPSLPTSPVSKFEINQEFITRFIKSKDALNEMESFTIHTEQGFNGNEMVFTVGNDTTESKINFSVSIDKDDFLNKSPYNADIFKEILKANKTCESGEIFVYSEGLLVVKFIDNQIESKYYLVRNQN